MVSRGRKPSHDPFALELVWAISRHSCGCPLVANPRLKIIKTDTMSPIGALMLLPLESRFPPWKPEMGDPAGIIVLGGGVDPEMTTARGTPTINASGARIAVAAELAYRYPKARLVYVGGNASPRSANLSEAARSQWAKQLL